MATKTTVIKTTTTKPAAAPKKSAPAPKAAAKPAAKSVATPVNATPVKTAKPSTAAPDTAKPAVKKTPTKSKTAIATPVAKKSNSKTKQSMALFIDVDNVGISRENLLEILFFVNGKYNVELCKLYGFNEETLPGIKEIADDYNLTTVGKMKFKTPGENCLDPRLLIDAYECAVNNANCIDCIFVWCYPCDLGHLFEKIVSLGIATATIDNRAFDCKNKYVSQVFKIYSPYNFALDTPMYGQVQNLTPEQVATVALPVEPEPEPQPHEIAPKIEPVETSSLPNPPVENNAPRPTVQVPDDLETLDGKPIPVLPRREVLERHSPQQAAAKPAQSAPDADEGIVDMISQKLNIFNSEPDLAPARMAAYDTNNNPKSTENTVSLIDVMRKAGVLGDIDDNKPKKYEDTIGDL